MFSGIKSLNLLQMKKVFSIILANCKDYTKKQLSLIKIEAFFLPLIVTLIGTSTILTIYIGGLKALKEKLQLKQRIYYICQYVGMASCISGWVTSIIQRACITIKN